MRELSWFGVLPGLILFLFLAVVVIVFLVVQAARASVNCARSGEARREGREQAKRMGEALKALRVRRGMTPEFVAGAVGVSPRAVLRWEKGVLALNTANLLPLADLYGVTVEELRSA